MSGRNSDIRPAEGVGHARSIAVKYWEIIADNLSKAVELGLSLSDGFQQCFIATAGRLVGLRSDRKSHKANV